MGSASGWWRPMARAKAVAWEASGWRQRRAAGGGGDDDDGGGQAEEGYVPVQGAEREPAVDAGLAGLPEAEKEGEGSEEENGRNEAGRFLAGQPTAD